MTSETGEVEAVMGVMVDITQERIRETALAALVTQDALTGMLNRRGLWQNMDALLVEDPSAFCLALFAIDLDHFKATNDKNGHAAGDAALVEAARRLAAAGEGAICTRLGGDEFIVVVRLASELEAHRLRDRLCQEFRRPVAFRGRWLPVSASEAWPVCPGLSMSPALWTPLMWTSTRRSTRGAALQQLLERTWFHRRLSFAPVMSLDVPEMRSRTAGFIRVNLPMASRGSHGFDLVPHRFGIRDGDPLVTLFDLALCHHAGGLCASLGGVRGQPGPPSSGPS